MSEKAKKYEVRRVSIDKMNPAPYNPRIDLKPTDPEYQHIKNSVERFGYLEPIVWNERTGNIVSGHQRFKIIVEQGATEIDVCCVDFDEEREKACNLAMNKAVGLWDNAKLDELLAELSVSDWDMSDYGFDVIDPDAFGEDFNLPDGDKGEICTMTLTLHQNQLDLIESAIDMLGGQFSETYGNENRNGNSIHEIVRQWIASKR